MTTRGRMFSTGLALAVVLASIAGCGSGQSGPSTLAASRADTGRDDPRAAQGRTSSRTVITPSVRSDPGVAPVAVPSAVTATRTPTDTARAWALAANSTSYRDAAAGSWTGRTAPFVAGAEAAQERRQRGGAGGSTWALIQTAKCVTGLRQLAIGTPSRDAPTGPDLRIVNVSAVIDVTCATGQVQLTPFAVQLTVTRVRGRWLVADVQR